MKPLKALSVPLLLALASCVAARIVPIHLGGDQEREKRVDDAPPIPKGLPPIVPPPGDDWRQFGHDAARTNCTKEAVDLPLLHVWTWKASDRCKVVSNAVAAAGYVHLHILAEGNGEGRDSGFRNPRIVCLNGLNAEYRGAFSPRKDVSYGHWLAVFDNYKVVYNDDALGAFDCRDFTDHRWVKLDRWGAVAVDETAGLAFHVNDKMADKDPPLLECNRLDGSSAWRANVWPVKKGTGYLPVNEVNISAGVCLAAVRYAGPSPGAPKDGVYAFEATKGQQLWLYEGRFRNLASTAKRVYALNDGGTIHALDLRTGRAAWKAELGPRVVGSPGLWKDRLVAVLSNGELTALGIEGANEGKTLWTAKVENFHGGRRKSSFPGLRDEEYDTTAMILSAQGRAVVCTSQGVAVYDLEQGTPIGTCAFDVGVLQALDGAPVNPILARGTLYVCGKDTVAAFWTGTFLRENGAFVAKQAETAHKEGRLADAVRMARILGSVEGLKDASRRKAADVLAALVKDGEKRMADARKIEEKRLLGRAKAAYDEVAAAFGPTDPGPAASERSAELAKQLEDPAIAAEAGFKEARELEMAGKRREAARAYKAVAERYPDTDFGRQAAEKYRNLKDYDK